LFPALGVLAAALVVFAVAWIGEFNGVGFNQTGPLVRWGTLPVSVGLFGFCYSGHAVFPNIYNSMANKRQFPLLLTAT
jgi:vesicular inhibitory amino acid transporter